MKIKYNKHGLYLAFEKKAIDIDWFYKYCLDDYCKNIIELSIDRSKDGHRDISLSFLIWKYCIIGVCLYYIKGD